MRTSHHVPSQGLKPPPPEVAIMAVNGLTDPSHHHPKDWITRRSSPLNHSRPIAVSG
jgi:hypothetical protein